MELAESDSVTRALCIRQGFIQPSETLESLNRPSEVVDPSGSIQRTDVYLFSKLQRQGYTNEDSVSYWSLLRAKLRNRRGQSFPQSRYETTTDDPQSIRLSMPDHNQARSHRSGHHRDNRTRLLRSRSCLYRYWTHPME